MIRSPNVSPRCGRETRALGVVGSVCGLPVDRELRTKELTPAAPAGSSADLDGGQDVTMQRTNPRSGNPTREDLRRLGTRHVDEGSLE